MWEREVKEDSPDVVIVGAGPVGLWIALELEAKIPGLKILLYEKNKKYTRPQPLRLSYARVSGNAEVKTALDETAAKGNAEMDEKKGNISIPIQDLEANFLACVKTHPNIRIEYQAVASGEALKQAYPHCPFFIGTDGHRSTIRKTVFGVDQDHLPKENLQHMIELKYQVEGKAVEISEFYYLAIQTSLGGCVADHEHIKYDSEKKRSEVTQRFLVDAKTFNDPRLAAAKAADPLRVTQDLPESLRTAIAVCLNGRSEPILVPRKNPRIQDRRIKEDKDVPGPRLNKTILHVYKNEASYQVEEEAGREQRVWFLGGDAVIGLSFMKGLNAGLESGSKLADLIAEHFRGPQLFEKQDRSFTAMGKAYEAFNGELYARKKAEVQRINDKVNKKRAAISTLRFLSRPIKASVEDSGSGFIETEHPVFGRMKKKWPWILGGFLLFSALAVASVLTFGLIDLTIAALVVLPILGALAGHRAWKWNGPYEPHEIDDAPAAAPGPAPAAKDSQPGELAERHAQPAVTPAPPSSPQRAPSSLDRSSPGSPAHFRIPSPTSSVPLPSAPVHCKPGL